jgi:hypothetical protein
MTIGDDGIATIEQHRHERECNQCQNQQLDN